ncbi:double zinc ribbon domain-containing protein [Halomarina litorea]|uniref:double zinc ribbon domain-containing protein n=1 Tax=Halomarina litorea TaxID=2961595 RepID=UPI0020C24B87|nr:zinc ribbon domain-containing protein [Halomarina sp. BCD28]
MSSTTERYCRACGESVAPDTDVCPHCGVGTRTTDVGTPMAYCRDCGEEIRSAAEICPHCGVRQQPAPASFGSVESDLESLFRRNRGVVAAVASFFFPGLGQLLNREVVKGLLVFVGFVAASFSIVFGVGLILAPAVFVYGVYDAYRTGKRLETAAEGGRPHA